jgi:regulator of RNase E activity RraA
LRSARFGDFLVESSDIVFADDDGCIFVNAEFADDLLRVAREIWQRERRQAEGSKAATRYGNNWNVLGIWGSEQPIQVIRSANTCEK